MRNEQTASFKVDGARGLWFDFGTGEGGTIIELVQSLYRESDVSRVLATIADIMGGAARLPPCPLDCRQEESRDPPRIEWVGPLADSALITYLTGTRGIPFELGARYLQEVHYQAAGHGYRAL